MEIYDHFTEIYSISDLHLTTGAHVDQPAVQNLATTIGALASRPGADHALVVNGDIVDFLDISPCRYFDPQGAPGKLDDVFSANAVVFDALAEFAGKHTVVLTLGNHDIELAMPACQSMLRRKIGGKLALSFDGAGYRCRVGTANALFLHGNNEDEWNHVSYHALGVVAARLNAGLPFDADYEWDPNEGTRLVIEWLNQAKKAHPFLEFLKPEGLWLGTLMSKLGLDSLANQAANFGRRRVAAIAGYHARGLTRESAYLGGPGGISRPNLLDGDHLLLDADRRYRDGARVLREGGMSGSLGVFLKRRESDDKIREHIQTSLADDQTFAVRQSDEIYDRLQGKIAECINFVVCGHTHLRRSLRVRQNRAYFNSGTWMRLIDLKEASQDATRFPTILNLLENTTREKLDAMTPPDPLHSIVIRQPTVVILSATPNGRHAGWLADASLSTLPEVLDSRVELMP